MDNDLVTQFLSGQASEEEIGRLRAEIERDPGAVDALFEAAELERDLAEVFRVAAPRRRAWPVLAIAAAALLAVAASVLFLKTEVARVETLQGKILRDGTPLALGDAIYAGDALEAAGRVVLRYDDGTTVELKPGSRARDFATKGGKQLLLERGSLSADVRPQQQAMVVRSPEGEARVLGTRFTLSVTGGSSRLDVEKGLVRLTRLSDGKSADVAAGQTAVVSAGAAPVAQAPGTWRSLPGTKMASVTPDPARFASTRGTSGPSAVIGAWSGAALDTRRNRLVLWGGGYSDYAGNELYVFALDSMAWQRLTDPTAPPRLNEQENADGTPTSRATYNGLAYLPQADRLFTLGGARAGNGFGCNVPWTFDFASKSWAKRAAAPAGGLGGCCSYDPVTRKLWWGDGSGTYSLDVDSERWTKHNDEPFYYQTGTIDPKRGLWVLIGNGKSFAVDVRGGAPVRREWKTSGGDAIVARPNPGVDFDPVRDRIVAWGGGPVYSLDPESRAWTVLDAPGAPPATPNGIYGRWRYVPALDAFIVVTAMDQDVHLFKPAR